MNVIDKINNRFAMVNYAIFRQQLGRFYKSKKKINWSTNLITDHLAITKW